jgi:4-hydroxybenzoate polyprenyltransferase
MLASAGATVIEGHLALVALASTCFYAAGTAMNDLVDARTDQNERPGRPIPSGGVPKSAAAIAVLLLFAAGFAVAYAVGPTAVKVAAGLTLAIFLYNVVLKRIQVVGPMAMGACRGLSILLGAALYPETILGKAVIAGVLVEMIYVAAVTQLARYETGGGAPPDGLLWFPAGLLFAGMMVFACVVPLPAQGDLQVLTAFVVLSCARAFVSTVKPRRGRGFRRAGIATLPVVIGSLVSNVIFIQSTLIVGAGAGRYGVMVACAILALWPLNRLLASKFYAS